MYDLPPLRTQRVLYSVGLLGVFRVIKAVGRAYQIHYCGLFLAPWGCRVKSLHLRIDYVVVVDMLSTLFKFTAYVFGFNAILIG